MPQPIYSPKDERSNPGRGNPISQEAHAIDALREEVKSMFDWVKSHASVATKQDLKETETKIMSAISEFQAKQVAFNTRQGAAVDAAVASVGGLSTDIQALTDKITELQNSAGQVTPEDQALLNELETQGDAVATKVEALSSALSALDALNPPTPPPAP